MGFTRRQFLATGSVASVSFASGCATIRGENNGETLLRPVAIGYSNWDDSPHTLEIVVSIQGSIEYWETLELDSDEASDPKHVGGTLDIPFPSEPVEYTVFARLDGAETAQTTSAAGIQVENSSVTEADYNCARVVIRVETPRDVDVENWKADEEYCST